MCYTKKPETAATSKVRAWGSQQTREDDDSARDPPLPPGSPGRELIIWKTNPLFFELHCHHFPLGASTYCLKVVHLLLLNSFGVTIPHKMSPLFGSFGLVPFFSVPPSNYPSKMCKMTNRDMNMTSYNNIREPDHTPKSCCWRNKGFELLKGRPTQDAAKENIHHHKIVKLCCCPSFKLWNSQVTLNLWYYHKNSWEQP